MWRQKLPWVPMTYEKGVRLTVWDSYCGKTVLSPNNCLAQITVPTTLRTNSGLCTKRPSIHHYMTSLTPVRYQAVLGSLPGPGSILDRIRAAAEPNASKIGSMPAAKLSNCRRKTLERRLWPGEEEASAETGGLAPRGCARHGCSSHKPTMGRTGCHWLRPAWTGQRQRTRSPLR